MSCFVECPRCDGLTWVGDGCGDVRDCPLCFVDGREETPLVTSGFGFIALPVSAFVAQTYGEWVADYTNGEWPESDDAAYLGF